MTDMELIRSLAGEDEEQDVCDLIAQAVITIRLRICKSVVIETARGTKYEIKNKRGLANVKKKIDASTDVDL
jgi:hypothetical protein